jgi:hypothetical protein
MSDIDELRQKHPRWAIGSLWTTAGSGPDRRRLIASREGIQLHAWTAEDLSKLIADEEIHNNWPCQLTDSRPVPSL